MSEPTTEEMLAELDNFTSNARVKAHAPETDDWAAVDAFVAEQTATQGDGEGAGEALRHALLQGRERYEHLMTQGATSAPQCELD